MLQNLINDTVKCKHLGKDRYGRSLKECFLPNGISINREMVLKGWAVAYGDKFSAEQKTAQQNKKGIWAGKFMRPELYRALRRKTEKNKKR